MGGRPPFNAVEFIRCIHFFQVFFSYVLREKRVFVVSRGPSAILVKALKYCIKLNNALTEY